MKNLKKGCVYFFRHIGLTPIKIGYSENESPYKRFEQFKTYAPFGAELIGFIRTTRAKELETELHNKYSRDRIKGEWFEITKEETEKCISFYSNLEDIEEMNNFQVFWAKSFIKKNNSEDVTFKFINLFLHEYNNNCDIVILNQKEIADLLNVEKSDISLFMKDKNYDLKTYKVNGISKKGYKLFKKR
ncbi:nuclease [Flavobacterium phage vB_FspS_mymlan6-2]|uniref:Nuclease n=9 Tax=Muminvirus TaxID=2843426 RepID=A0A6B9LD70_9CAUD|nr:nuclease [Flavobacterium phage vB_FspS_mumin9-1]YP_009855109.1 nuclease [Flavobacterium phage vB_FspS_mymlan6-1]QHB39647.1 nuclease [Flavobacterium phage vB_FspS_mumin6-1]QHB39714.1 nuclease [Flavobacterium phage vB_FspS_mumin6-2]QHB39780.1 nuclease [Flavobacterium phage vB_FspS_mumin6-3]QHB39846.1 nuclease [Flavobacterium phage vB_FspS_mumin6-4]QHB39980.1 nuclease [Flavobacterium phage vB_FspS_mumin9-2]QHB40047.1 nuclease [Flavobacterium phage vB_FspS_mumin9-3]QHB40183.1 nuclease [Flavo